MSNLKDFTKGIFSYVIPVSVRVSCFAWSDSDAHVSRKNKLHLTVSQLRFVSCLRKVKYTFTFSSLLCWTVSLNLIEATEVFFLAAQAGTDHTTNHFSTIGCKIIIGFHDRQI